MSQALSETEKQFVQRFNTPVIRDYDFPPDSANRAMPYETEPAAPPATAPGVQPEKPEPPATVHTTAVIPDVTPVGLSKIPAPAGRLDPGLIPKFVSRLTKPPVFCPVRFGDDEYLYMIDIVKFRLQILPEGFPETTVLGYGGNVLDEEARRFRYDASTPGATFEAVRNMPVRIKWINKLGGTHPMAGGTAFHQGNAAGGSIPAVTRLHGANGADAYNGHPDAWFTSDGRAGPRFRTPCCAYPNSRDAATLWYGDNARGVSQANVYAGLAGFYLLRSGMEFGWQRDGILPRGQYEIPLIIQDRSFNSDGSLSFIRADGKLFGRDCGFLGDTITVNGKVWPNLSVERRQYRFRLLNASGARVYNLRMGNGMTLTQIGTGNGFLSEPKTVESLRLAPTDCADILVDFSGIEPGTKIILTNDPRSPFPGSDASEPETTGQIMQFTVPPDAQDPVRPKKLPKRLK